MEEVKLLVLRLTERCNLRCAYCYAARDDHPVPDMDESTALEAVRLCCPPGGTLRIQFTGGEPLLRQPLMEAVAGFGKRTGRNLILSVQTNGTLLTEDACRRLKKMRCGVGVSLDGVGDANRLRVFSDGTASDEAVLEGIRNLGQVGLRCGLTAVVTGANAAELGNLADLALCMGNIAGVGLDLFRPLGRGKGQNLSPNPERLEAGLRALKKRAEDIAQAKIPFRLRELERLHKRKLLTGCSETYCYAQTDLSLAVDGNGDCWPCSSLTGRDGFLIGNIRDGLPAVGGSSKNLEAPETCKQCGSYACCLGGCPAGRAARGDVERLTCVMHRVLAEERE
jgi:uncharacterized protein